MNENIKINIAVKIFKCLAAIFNKKES